MSGLWLALAVLMVWLAAELVTAWFQSRRPDADSEVWLVESDPRRTWNRI